ncbi:MAG TPA: K(+)-transporting ATPase subunit C [Candidatus Hydrogenedentes bacterium]|nr:K(+)-transporting ATPase subunit C [Candidatus Hydrogenedentota bacterium]
MKEITTGLRLTATLVILLCGIYPIVTLVIGQAFFPAQADGSLLIRHGAINGSELIAQSFSGPRYFHPRPSCAGTGYDVLHSGGSNLGPTSAAWLESVKARATVYRQENGLSADVLIPADAVTASGSGLDPDISFQNAQLQVSRVARARGLREEVIWAKIQAVAEGRTLWILGEPRINVLRLNMDLDNQL